MRRGNDIAAMRKIVDIRHVQRRAAELEVLLANAQVARSSARRHARQDVLQQDIGRWAQAVSEPTMSVNLASTWAAEILSGKAALGQLEDQIASAKAEKARRDDDWRSAHAHVEAAETLKTSASKRIKRQSEAAALNDLADRLLQRRAQT